MRCIQSLIQTSREQHYKLIYSQSVSPVDQQLIIILVMQFRPIMTLILILLRRNISLVHDYRETNAACYSLQLHVTYVLYFVILKDDDESFFDNPVSILCPVANT